MKLYSKNKTKKEIIEYIKNQASLIKNEKYHRYKNILSLVTGHGKKYILDYGCGWGILSNELKAKGNKVLGIDLIKNEIEICKIVWKEDDNLQFSHAKINELNDKVYDYVVSSQVIEHVHNPGIYLSEINRVLKNNGKLVISIPNILNPDYMVSTLSNKTEKNLKKISQYIIDKYDKVHTHIHAWDAMHFVRLLSTAGFLLERYETEGKVPVCLPFVKRIYIKTQHKRIRNMSFRLIFSFKKVRNVRISKNE